MLYKIYVPNNDIRNEVFGQSRGEEDIIIIYRIGLMVLKLDTGLKH